MRIVRPGDKVRVIKTVYGNPAAALEIMARPGDIAVVVEWMNAGTFRARLANDEPLLLHSSECEPIDSGDSADGPSDEPDSS